MNNGLSGHTVTFLNSGTKVMCRALTLCSLTLTSQLAFGQAVNTEALINSLEEGIVNIDKADPSKTYLEGLIERIEDGQVKFDGTDIRPKSEEVYDVYREGLLEGLQAGMKSFDEKNDSNANLEDIIEGIKSSTANMNRDNPPNIYILGIVEGLEESRKSIAQGKLSKAVLKTENDLIRIGALSFRAIFNDVYYAPGAKSPMGIMIPTDSGNIAVDYDPQVLEKSSLVTLLVDEHLKLASPKVRQRYQRAEAAILRSRMRAATSDGLKTVATATGSTGLTAADVANMGLKLNIEAVMETDTDATPSHKNTSGQDTADKIAATTTSVGTVGIVARGYAKRTAGRLACASYTASFGAIIAAESIRRGVKYSAGHHCHKLAFDDVSMEMGTSMTINLMQRNAYLRDIGEINQEELIRRNNALADSARKEGERTVKEARWIGDRYNNVGTAIFGTLGSGWDYRFGG